MRRLGPRDQRGAGPRARPLTQAGVDQVARLAQDGRLPHDGVGGPVQLADGAEERGPVLGIDGPDVHHPVGGGHRAAGVGRPRVAADDPIGQLREGDGLHGQERQQFQLVERDAARRRAGRAGQRAGRDRDRGGDAGQETGLTVERQAGLAHAPGRRDLTGQVAQARARPERHVVRLGLREAPAGGQGRRHLDDRGLRAQRRRDRTAQGGQRGGVADEGRVGAIGAEVGPAQAAADEPLEAGLRVVGGVGPPAGAVDGDIGAALGQPPGGEAGSDVGAHGEHAHAVEWSGDARGGHRHRSIAAGPTPIAPGRLARPDPRRPTGRRQASRGPRTRRPGSAPVSSSPSSVIWPAQSVKS